AAPAEPTAAPAEPTAAPAGEAAPENGAAAGDLPDPASIGDPDAGQQLWNQNLINTSGGVAAGCVTCHYVEAARGDFTGPNMAGIAVRAQTRVPDQSAVEYLRNSIVNSNEYVVEGYSAGVMPQNYGDILSEEQINNLVAYLLTLQGE
ncbi:MAG: c-type cytochrome, partial [Chloroflexaceae bacterium]